MAESSVVEVDAAGPQTKTRPHRFFVQTIATFIWFVGSLFLGAGRLDWVRGWISAGLSVVGMTIVGLIIRRCNTGLLEERAKWRRKDTKRFDKIFLAIYVPLLLIQPAVAGLDNGRYHWSSMPLAFVYVGALIFVLALTLITWVLVVNPFAETSVRIQKDRGQHVITNGPYQIVRHPMYVGAILYLLANPLIWGSVAALIITLGIIPLMIWRTAREDRTLHQELAGYPEYAARTRYRLVPGLW